MVRKVKIIGGGRHRSCACCRAELISFNCFKRWWADNLYSPAAASAPLLPTWFLARAPEIKRLWLDPYSNIICDTCFALMEELLDGMSFCVKPVDMCGFVRDFWRELRTLERKDRKDTRRVRRQFWYFLERGLITPDYFAKQGGEGD